MKLEQGMKVYFVKAFILNKVIMECEVLYVSPKTVMVRFPGGDERRIRLVDFENAKEGNLKDSFTSWALTEQDAQDHAVILMDAVLARKFTQLKTLQKEIDQGVKIRNKPATLRRNEDDIL